MYRSRSMGGPVTHAERGACARGGTAGSCAHPATPMTNAAMHAIDLCMVVIRLVRGGSERHASHHVGHSTAFPGDAIDVSQLHAWGHSHSRSPQSEADAGGQRDSAPGERESALHGRSSARCPARLV